MDRHENATELSSALSDASKFSSETIQKDVSGKMDQMLFEIPKRMKDEFIVNCDLYEHPRPSDSSVMTLYGLPKFHKNNVLIRSIFEMNSSSYYLIVKWLADIVRPVRKHINSYNSHDLFDSFDSEISV